ncbi:MAG: hypothetical protein EWM72_02150 [Nitrospira sp.]|nr:MAG: hypothetical protein EWM72_02150 [Nitrospira sp.]
MNRDDAVVDFRTTAAHKPLVLKRPDDFGGSGQLDQQFSGNRRDGSRPIGPRPEKSQHLDLQGPDILLAQPSPGSALHDQTDLRKAREQAIRKAVLIHLDQWSHESLTNSRMA